MNDFTTTIKNKIDSINVVQTTGQSTTDVMSQKAVTDALGAAGNGDMLKSVYDTNDNGKVDGAEAADKLSTSRSFTLTGDVTGTTNSDLSSNLSIGATLANSGVTAGTYTSVTVDAKGRVTAGTTPSLVMHSTSHELPNGVLSVWIGTMAQWSVIGSGNYNPAILYLVKP
jgi:phage-related tail fiber protein